MPRKKKPIRRHLPVLIEQDEDGIFIGSIPTIPGCHAQGDTEEEMLKNEQILLEKEKALDEARLERDREVERLKGEKQKKQG